MVVVLARERHRVREERDAVERLVREHLLGVPSLAEPVVVEFGERRACGDVVHKVQAHVVRRLQPFETVGALPEHRHDGVALCARAPLVGEQSRQEAILGRRGDVVAGAVVAQQRQAVEVVVGGLEHRFDLLGVFGLPVLLLQEVGVAALNLGGQGIQPRAPLGGREGGRGAVECLDVGERRVPHPHGAVGVVHRHEAFGFRGEVGVCRDGHAVSVVLVRVARARQRPVGVGGNQHALNVKDDKPRVELVGRSVGMVLEERRLAHVVRRLNAPRGVVERHAELERQAHERVHLGLAVKRAGRRDGLGLVLDADGLVALEVLERVKRLPAKLGAVVNARQAVKVGDIHRVVAIQQQVVCGGRVRRAAEDRHLDALLLVHAVKRPERKMGAKLPRDGRQFAGVERAGGGRRVGRPAERLVEPLGVGHPLVCACASVVLRRQRLSKAEEKAKVGRRVGPREDGAALGEDGVDGGAAPPHRLVQHKQRHVHALNANHVGLRVGALRLPATVQHVRLSDGAQQVGQGGVAVHHARCGEERGRRVDHLDA